MYQMKGCFGTAANPHRLNRGKIHEKGKLCAVNSSHSHKIAIFGFIGSKNNGRYW